MQARVDLRPLPRRQVIRTLHLNLKLGHLMRAFSTSPIPMKGLIIPPFHKLFSQILNQHLTITLWIQIYLGELFLAWCSSSSNVVSKHFRCRRQKHTRAILTMLMRTYLLVHFSRQYLLKYFLGRLFAHVSLQHLLKNGGGGRYLHF